VKNTKCDFYGKHTTVENIKQRIFNTEIPGLQPLILKYKALNKIQMLRVQ